jgi:putative NADH-flavin reductase
MGASADKPLHQLPHHVAVIGGFGQGILRVCRAEGIAFTAICRSRPERIVDVPQHSKVAVVTSLAERAALSTAFSGADVVLTALGGTSTSNERSAMLSENAAEVEAAMLAAGVDRIIIINTRCCERRDCEKYTGHKRASRR